MEEEVTLRFSRQHLERTYFKGSDSFVACLFLGERTFSRPVLLMGELRADLGLRFQTSLEGLSPVLFVVWNLVSPVGVFNIHCTHGLIMSSRSSVRSMYDVVRTTSFCLNQS